MKQASKALKIPKEMVEGDINSRIDNELEGQASETVRGVANVKEALDGPSTEEIMGQEEHEVEDDVVDTGMMEVSEIVHV